MKRMRIARKLDGLLLAWLLSLAFLAASYARVIGDAGSAKLGGNVLNTILAQPLMGTYLGHELAGFVAALLLLHTLFAIACWCLARATLKAWPGCGNSQRVLSVFWFALLAAWVLAANAYRFPGTALGSFYHQPARTAIGGIPLFFILSFVLAAAITAVLVLAAIRGYGHLLRSRRTWVGITALLSVAVVLPAISTANSGSGKPFERPHIILVGIDSLRADFVRNEQHHWTPSIDEFLGHAVSFSNAYTPLARTFPAWVSILSGRHPHTTGAFVNLLPREMIHEGQTLPAVLGAHGYQTTYAIDEVRFSNLDQSYGFDKTLTPPMGAADFLLGFFADAPLANIVVNTVLGKVLFPYAYANRAASTIYDPDTFIDRIEADADFRQPTMLAVHLTLAHWPFTWADSPDPELTAASVALDPAATTRSRYELAVRRVDQQFKRLMTVLEAKGALDNAIVVVLSDHGESLGEPSAIDDQVQIFGHGTHVFSGDQYHVVLGMRSFGNPLIPIRPDTILSFPVSLEDITPTLLDMLELDQGLSFDGRSLLPYLGKDGRLQAETQARVRFLETEFNPPGISTEKLPSASAISAAAKSYRIDPANGRLVIQASFVGEILEQRQYAVERDGELLATVPAQGNSREQHLLHYSPQAGGVPVWLEQPPTANGDPRLYALWQALEQRFTAVRERRVAPAPVLAQANP